jgi:two-component sensor histidine kinase
LTLGEHCTLRNFGFRLGDKRLSGVARMGGEAVSDFLAGGGEMGALTRGFDWSRTSLGSPETWPQSLRVTVRLVLTSRHPMFIWWGPELIQFYNDAYRETMGPERHPSALGARGRDCWDEIWDIIGPQIEYVMAGKGATWHEDQLVPVTRHGRRENVWWTYSFGPIDFEGKVGGVLVVCRDVTSEHMAREALNLINEELKHRVKNTLAVLGAVATQTFRDVSSKADLEKYQGRLAAFGRAHDLLTAANWAAAPLQDVIGTALSPYRTGGSRFTVSGPSLVVKSRQALALSLAIHELATNALKYGALTVTSGYVSIAWASEDQEGEPKFVFVWQEFGGPPASKPASVGFGSRLISRVLQDDFGGSVEVSYGSTGLICRLTAPLENLATSPNSA